MGASDALWLSLIDDIKVDVISPQFYSKNGYNADIVKTYSSSSVTYADYDKVTAKVAPTLKLSSPERFDSQAKQVQAKCNDGTLPASFCATGFYVWPSS